MNTTPRTAANRDSPPLRHLRGGGECDATLNARAYFTREMMVNIGM
jgi:hypothetical protein